MNSMPAIMRYSVLAREKIECNIGFLENWTAIDSFPKQTLDYMIWNVLQFCCIYLRNPLMVADSTLCHFNIKWFLVNYNYIHGSDDTFSS